MSMMALETTEGVHSYKLTPKEVRQMIASTIAREGDVIPYLVWRSAHVRHGREPYANGSSDLNDISAQRLKLFRLHLTHVRIGQAGGALPALDAETAEIMLRTLHGQYLAIFDSIPAKKPDTSSMRRGEMILDQWLALDKYIKEEKADGVLNPYDRAEGRESRCEEMRVLYAKAHFQLGRPDPRRGL